ncbi:hypothetical protein ACERK3_06600 [Phycisphaerales bacterium AB-hyl4]|uniref:Flp pilus-assembly TadG-like N-terminal domain-containing protein n=1 Tax=Natronomicrosphaera hydrolytica TaxID=3242702 RepID=A0ABV4U355_9BACT
MQGNLTTAAWIFGGAMVVASLVLVIGIFFSVNMAMNRADATARQHAQAMERAGVTAGDSARATTEAAIERIEALVTDDVLAAVEGHANSIETAGQTLREAFESPLAVSVTTDEDTPMTVSVTTDDAAPMTVQMGRPLEINQPVVIEGTHGEDRALSVHTSLFE